MNRSKMGYLRLGVLGAVLAGLLAVSLACAATEPTPVPSATPAPAAAPTAALPPTATPTLTVAPTPTAPAVAKPTYGGTLRVAIPLGFQTLSPYHVVDYREQIANFAIYDSLVEAEEDFNIVPGLARSWEVSADGKAITFNLVRGARFHDGTEPNAEAVKWNFERIQEPEFRAKMMRGLIGPYIERVEVKDTYTVTVHLKKPYRPFLGHITMAYFRIISPAAWQKLGEKRFGANPTGTGPFKLKEWAPGSHVTLVRNDDFWDKGKPYLDAIKFQDVSDKVVRVAMLRTGETDVLEEVHGREVDLIKASPNAKMVPFDSTNWIALAMDANTKLWSNKALRQGVSYAIDKQKIVDVWLEGRGRVAHSMGLGWYSTPPDYRPYQYNLQKAREKLAEAGYPGGLTIDYWCRSVDVEIELCEMIQAMLGEVGIKANIIRVLMANWYTERNGGKIAFGYAGGFPRADPDYQLRAKLHSQYDYGKLLGLRNPGVDRLLDEATGIFDIAKAGPMYVKAQTLGFDEAVYISLYFPTVYAGLNKRVQNFFWVPDTLVRLRDLWLEK